MRVIRLFDFPVFSGNIYLLEKDNHVLIVDLGYYSNELKFLLKDKTIDGIILTHKHFDHFYGCEDFLKDYPNINIYSFNDGNDYNDSSLNGGLQFNCPRTTDIHTIDIGEGKNNIGIFNFEAIYTPGHTTDSITLFFDNEKCLFTGDFLFANSIGRTDMKTGSANAMRLSLRKIQPYLKDDYMLYPGHEKEALISMVKRVNPYL